MIPEWRLDLRVGPSPAAEPVHECRVPPGDPRAAVARPTPQRDLPGRDSTSPPAPSEEAVITAIVAAVLFAIALVLHLAGLSLGPLDVTAFQLAGLLAVGLHLAGIGTSRRVYARRR